MPVSSYVIRCRLADQPAVRRRLTEMPGLELGESTDFGFPVVAESESSRRAAEIGEEIQALPGVQSAVLVYHNFEDVVESAPFPAQS